MQFPLIGKIKRPLPWVIALVAVGVVGAGAVSFILIRAQRNDIDIAELTVPVESQPLGVRITASGTVQPIDTVNLSPRTSDLVAELYVEQGDRVSQGQVVARMKSNSVEAELTQARARVVQWQAEVAELRNGTRPEDIAQGRAQVERADAVVAEAEARLELATDRLNRNRVLQEEGAISRDDIDAAAEEAERARANLEQNRASLREAQENLRLLQRGSRAEDIAQAEAQLAQAQGNLQAVEVQYDDTFIRAPFDGIITQKYATEGAFVTPTTSASEASSATSSAIVAIASGLEVLTEVPEVDISRIRQGQPVEIVADAYPDQVFEGRVKRIAPQAIEDPSRGDFVYFEVTVELITGEDQLMSGIQTDVTFIGDEVSGAMVVPAVAVVRVDGQQGVLLPDENDRPRFQPVTLGPQVGNEIQILEGVDPGDRIFVELPEGTTLENLNFGRRDQEGEE
ncbi:MAG: efflux RND transporter periplasmic adaptor subunit [Elainellaceae cyanobacterium]